MKLLLVAHSKKKFHHVKDQLHARKAHRGVGRALVLNIEPLDAAFSILSSL